MRKAGRAFAFIAPSDLADSPPARNRPEGVTSMAEHIVSSPWSLFGPALRPSLFASPSCRLVVRSPVVLLLVVSYPQSCLSLSALRLSPLGLP